MAAGYDRGGRLVRALAALAMMLGLAAALASRPPRGGDPSQAERPLRVVVHVDFAQTTHERQKKQQKGHDFSRRRGKSS